MHNSRVKVASVVAAGIVCVFVAAFFNTMFQHKGEEISRLVLCRNHLMQIGLAFQNYYAAWDSYPPVAICDRDGRPLLSWRVAILPFLEEVQLYNQFHHDEPWDSPHNLRLAEQMPAVFWCPSQPFQGKLIPMDMPSARLQFEKLAVPPKTTCFVAITGERTIFPPGHTVKRQDVTDAIDLTAFVGEVQSSKIVWTKPEDVVFGDKFQAPDSFGSVHWDGTGWFMLMGSGGTRFIRRDTDPRILRAIMTIAGGERVGDDDF